jgi:hypothetical protein
LDSLVSMSVISVILHGVGQNAESFDLYFEGITGLHEYGRLTRHSDAARRASDDDIAWLQGHRNADRFDQLCNAKDELVCSRILQDTAIQSALDAQPASSGR